MSITITKVNPPRDLIAHCITSEVHSGHTVAFEMPRSVIDLEMQRLRQDQGNQAQQEALVKNLPVSVNSFSCRRPFLDLMQSATEWAFAEYNLPTEDGADIGSGVSGHMVEELMSNVVSPKNWPQIELNAEANRIHRQQTPHADIRDESYLRIGDRYPGKFSLITGLSSLDTTLDLDPALRQVTKALIKGGYLFHIQDVGPSWHFVYEAFHRLYPHADSYTLFVPNADLASDILTPPLAIHSSDSGIMHGSVELFHTLLGEKVKETPGLKTIANIWVKASIPITGLETHRYVNGMSFGVIGGQTPSVRDVYLAINIAQKTA